MSFITEEIARPQHDQTRPGAIRPKWIFTEEELKRSPSVLAGVPFPEEQRHIRVGATYIRMISDRLNEVQKDMPNKITQLCVSVSIIQLRRFFVVQSVREFEARDVGAAILFMCTKSEECPRRLEYIVRTWFKIRYEFDNKAMESKDPVTLNKDAYGRFCEYITWLENIALQTIGFNFGAEVPHPHVLSMSNEYRPTDKKFQEMVFWLVTDALHLTNWSLRFNPKKIAAISFYMASIWKDETPQFPSADANGISWFKKMDPTLTINELQDLTREFLVIWKDIDKNVHLPMSQFDHKTTPVCFNRLMNGAKPIWQL